MPCAFVLWLAGNGAVTRVVLGSMSRHISEGFRSFHGPFSGTQVWSDEMVDLACRALCFACVPLLGGLALFREALPLARRVVFRVAVLELERQVAVLELGENFRQLSDLVNEAKALEWERQEAVEKLEARFQRLSDLVNETKALEWERQLAVVELKENFRQLSDRVNETKALVGLVDDQVVNTRKAFTAELTCTKLSTLDEVEARYGDWSLQHDRLMLEVGHRLQQLEE